MIIAMKTITSMMMPIRIFAAVTAMAFGAPTAVAAELSIMDDLVPHKALYDIKMVSKDSGSQILNISGQMFYEWR